MAFLPRPAVAVPVSGLGLALPWKDGVRGVGVRACCGVVMSWLLSGLGRPPPGLHQSADSKKDSLRLRHCIVCCAVQSYTVALIKCLETQKH